MSSRKILALVGSPRKNSTSESLAQYLLDGLAANRWEISCRHISPAIKQPKRWAELEADFLSAGVIVLCCPLYVDSLPAETTLALERLCAVRRMHTPSEQRFLSVINCGFIEAFQNDVALAICQQFAKESGLIWSGGLALGGGGGIGGKPLKELGGMVRNITGAFDLVIAALNDGKEVPPESFELIRRKALPAWLYFMMANLGMIKGALDNHALLRINAQPYR